MPDDVPACPRGFLWCRLRFASALATVSCRARLQFYTPWIGASRSLQVSRRLRQAHSIPDIIPTRVSGPAPVRRGRLCRGRLWPSTRRSAHRSASTTRRVTDPAGSAAKAICPQSPVTPSPHRRIVFWRIVCRFTPITPLLGHELRRVSFSTDQKVWGSNPYRCAIYSVQTP